MQACAIDFPRLIAWIALSPSRARAIPPNHSLLNRFDIPGRGGAASGARGRPDLFGPFTKLSRTAGVRSSNTCRRSDVSIDMVREQSENAD